MNPPDLDLRNLNSLWGGICAETLRRCGVSRAVISPGSRSTPLTLALARHTEIECIPVLDERSAAFFALGLAKQGGEPVVLLCTSGTAGANYFPAVIEAKESGVPLIVITADRPPEMRACASGQTIDQLKLFGDYVNFFHEFALPEADEARFRYLRQTLAHAVERALQPNAGPVHLNMSFRDPLPPTDDGGATATFAAAMDWPLFFQHLIVPVATSITSAIPQFLSDVHGLIIAGPSQPVNPAAHAAVVGEIAQRLGWPVLADGLSPLRNHAGTVPHLVTTYDTILRNPEIAERLKPEVVICLGGWPTSKILRAWLEASGARVWLVTRRFDNRDALHGRTMHLPVSLAALAAELPYAMDPNGYEQMWGNYEHHVRVAMDDRITQVEGFFEGRVTALLAQHLPEETTLCIANSMPVRDMEYFWPPGDQRIRPLCNRGANGIDGTLSTALGVAHASGGATTLLTGDLALLHDTNGWLIVPKFKGSLTVVLVNNAGGGIFEHLPVAQFDPPFEEFFATPQVMDFAKLCAAYGVEHVAITGWEQFGNLVAQPPASGVRVLEVKTDRKKDAATRKELFARLATEL
ncbi:MAG: 2-succinyl-5-enolpyruvyl-6-hydroxy-3-cyclohexene-1-carboxylic-acid synthase [Undibacterium sp.]|nr:2-succinyl-5-enolpyruvyl-6-hydroxy-3-cyclohexene-1-carboxylic-acid synthase [Opitutaceae bacterium]